MDEMHTAPATPLSTCTLGELQDWLAALGLSEEEAAVSAVDLVRSGSVRLVGPHADLIARVAGRPPRLN